MRGGILETEARSILNVKPKATDAEVQEVRQSTCVRCTAPHVWRGLVTALAGG